LKLTTTEQTCQKCHILLACSSLLYIQTCIKGIQKSKGSIHVQLFGNFLYTLLFKMLHMLYTETSLVMLLEIRSIQWCLCSHNVNMSTPFLDYTIWFSWSEWVNFQRLAEEFCHSAEETLMWKVVYHRVELFLRYNGPSNHRVSVKTVLNALMLWLNRADSLLSHM
jgi:hypothetical protein